MLSDPTIQHRNEQFYLVIPATVHQRDIPQILPPLIPEIKTWMEEHQVAPSGPDFFLYKNMDNSGMMDCEAGFPVNHFVAGDERVITGSFPAGKYASIIYTGHFKYMMQAHMALENWIRQQGLQERSQTKNGKTEWGGRVEFYLVDPELEPNPEKWQTEIVFMLED
ncbi:MAG: AraC family transcriptional regulator [Chitinophagaceae bacterium]|nr:MAG: AraC family transcriptional regulator [Chitinophagaceae bacterium]